MATGVRNRGAKRLAAAVITAELTFLAAAAAAADKTRMIDLGTLGGTYSVAYGENRQGQVVGYSTTKTGFYHAFLWENGRMADLGGLGAQVPNLYSYSYGIAYRINGQFPSAAGRAFIINKELLVDLGTLGGLSAGALGINNRGQVVGYSSLAGGETGTP